MAKKRPSARLQKRVDVQARYDAAGSGRRMSGWVTPSSGPNRAITGLQKIRDRARDLARNGGTGASNVRVWTTNVVGTGIVPRPATKNKTLKKALTDLWNRWVPAADADGVLDFYGLQALVVRSWFLSGEVFIRMRPRRPSDGVEVPMQIQVLEADLLPVFDADAWPNMPTQNKIRQGVELSPIGKRVAYWFYKEHPGDNFGGAPGTTDLVRVLAESVCHVYEPLRPGQLRGVPEMASVITRLRNTEDLDDAVLERYKLANLFTAFFVKPMPSGANDAVAGLPFTGDPNEPLATLEPGTSQELLPGEDVRFSDPPAPGAAYPDFMREQHLHVSAGSGVPYELAVGDVKDVSDRTLRIVINEFRRLCEQRQWLIFIPMMCRKVRNAWADAAYLAGLLTDAELVEAKDVIWSPQAWPYIHPVQDVQSKQLEVEAGFRSRSSVIAQSGEDPDAVDEERAADKEREDKLGITPPVPDPMADPAKQAAAQKAKAETDLFNAQAGEARAREDRERRAIDADEARHTAEAERLLAEAEMLRAKADEASANAGASRARMEHDLAEAQAKLDALKAAQAQSMNESEARVAALTTQADASRKEADEKAAALARAEEFAAEQRALVLAAEHARAQTAELERQAAEVGLAELRG